jgi:hypothetical protein
MLLLLIAGCVEKIRMLRFSQIWPQIFATRAKEIAPTLSLSEWRKNWSAKEAKDERHNFFNIAE